MFFYETRWNKNRKSTKKTKHRKQRAKKVMTIVWNYFGIDFSSEFNLTNSFNNKIHVLSVTLKTQ